MTVFGRMANSRVRACAPIGGGEVVKLVDFLFGVLSDVILLEKSLFDGQW